MSITKKLLFVISFTILMSNTLSYNLQKEPKEELVNLIEEKVNNYPYEKRAINAVDVHQLRKISAVSISPDGSYFVFQINKWNQDTETSTTTISSFEIATSKVVNLNVQGNYNSPTFSKTNERLYIVSADSKTISYVSFPFKDTKDVIVPTDVVSFPIEISNVKVSLAENAFVFSANVYQEFDADLQKTFDKDAEIAKRGSNTYEVYDQLMVNHWDVWNSHKVSNLFYQKIKFDTKTNIIVTDGDLINLITGLEELNSPVPPFGGAEMFSISPDGLEVAFTGVIRKNEHLNTNWRVYTVTPGKTAVDIVTSDDAEKNFIGRTENPKYSADGKTIYFVAMPRAFIESDYEYLVSYNKADKTFARITKDFTFSISGYYLTDNNFAIVQVDYDGSTEHFSVPLSSTTVDNKDIIRLTEWSAGEGSKEVPFAITTNGSSYTTYFIETGDLVPNRISSITYKDNTWKKMSEEGTKIVYEPNPEFYDNFLIPNSEKFHFKGATSTTQGWIIYPVNYIEVYKYPVAMIIHGGPEGSLGNTWSYRWNPLLWASQDFVVVMINPEGSTGQGQKYVDAVRNNWGGAPYETLMAGLDYVGKQYPIANIDNACAAGASYGGYMINWIQGQTKRFKCLVTHDGVFSTLSMFYMTDEMWFPTAEYCPVEERGCTPYEEKYRDGFLKYSPEKYVNNWSTPHLIIHGSNDLRIPVSEGISAFTALQLKRVPSKFVHFTEENHWVLKPQNSIGWYENVLSWFLKYTKKASSRFASARDEIREEEI